MVWPKGSALKKFEPLKATRFGFRGGVSKIGDESWSNWPRVRTKGKWKTATKGNASGICSNVPNREGLWARVIAHCRGDLAFSRKKYSRTGPLRKRNEPIRYRYIARAATPSQLYGKSRGSAPIFLGASVPFIRQRGKIFPSFQIYPTSLFSVSVPMLWRSISQHAILCFLINEEINTFFAIEMHL
mgnify:CR=1 FL=1